MNYLNILRDESDNLIENFLIHADEILSLEDKNIIFTVSRNKNIYINEIFKLLLNKRTVFYKNNLNENLIISICKYQKDALLQERLLKNFTLDEQIVNEKDIHGRTALMYTAINTSVLNFEKLLEFTEDINYKDFSGNTVIGYLAMSKHEVSVDMLRIILNNKKLIRDDKYIEKLANGKEEFLDVYFEFYSIKTIGDKIAYRFSQMGTIGNLVTSKDLNTFHKINNFTKTKGGCGGYGKKLFHKYTNKIITNSNIIDDNWVPEFVSGIEIIVDFIPLKTNNNSKTPTDIDFLIQQNDPLKI